MENRLERKKRGGHLTESGHLTNEDSTDQSRAPDGNMASDKIRVPYENRASAMISVSGLKGAS